MRVKNYIKRNARKLAIIIIVFYFVAIPFLSLLILGSLKAQVNTQAAVLKQTQSITAQLQKNSAQRTAQIASINRHLDCIVAFFSQPDRTNKAIADINTCTLSTSERLLLNSSSTQSQNSVAPTTSASPSTSPSTPPADTSTQPKSCTINILFLHVGCQ